jgi:NADPH:quinone reductase-like Zn-dependent oxidoreductase
LKENKLMKTRAEAWFLYRGEGPQAAERAKLVRGALELPAITDDEILAEPIYGCWEGNMGHAIERRPLDLCHARGEPRIVLGNAGVLRILEVGRNVNTIEAGQYGILFGASVIDRFGYPELIFGYDAPGTMGCLATKMKLKQHEIIPLAQNTRYSLERWAAFSVRYVTAWANWRLAYGTFRLSVGEEEFPRPNVWGWGGGTTLGQLDLAQRFGCKVVMLSGNARRLETIANYGVEAVDRGQYGDLTFDERRFVTEPAYRREYLRAETAFLKDVKSRTSGEMVQIFVDHIGSAIFRCTLKALGRGSVLTTAGWKTGMTVSFLRAMECIGRHQHLHTHYARYQEGVEAVAYAEREGWLPEIDERIYAFDEIPTMAERFLANELGMFPVFSVNPP